MTTPYIHYNFENIHVDNNSNQCRRTEKYVYDIEVEGNRNLIIGKVNKNNNVINIPMEQ